MTEDCRLDIAGGIDIDTANKLEEFPGLRTQMGTPGVYVSPTRCSVELSRISDAR